MKFFIDPFTKKVDWFPVITSVTLIGLLIGVISLFVYVVYDANSGTTEIRFGKVIDKQYNPEDVSIGYGNTVLPNGQIQVVTTTTATSEKFLLIVDSKHARAIETNFECYKHHKLGDIITFNIRIGGISKGVISAKHACEL